MLGGRILLLWGGSEAELEALGDLFREDPTLVLATLGNHGEIPADLPPSDQVVILADWTRLSGELPIVESWRRALFPAPVGVLVRIEHQRLDEALLQTSLREVDDFLEIPCQPGYLTRRILAAFRYLTAQQGTWGLRAELAEQAADVVEFHRVALALAAESNVTRLLDLIVTKCREVTMADAGSLYLLEATPPEEDRGVHGPGRALRFVVAQNDSKPFDLASVTLPLDRSTIAGYVALTRTAVNLPDVYRLPPTVEYSFNPATDQRFGYRTVSMLAMPLIDQTHEVIGVVQVINKKRFADARLDTPEVAAREALPFDPRDEAMVRSLASLAAVVAVKGRRAEQTRLELDRQVRHAHQLEAMAGLAGQVAHDFNNFLTVITGRSALLLERLAPDDPLRRHVAFIDEAARGATDLTAELQAFSRGQVPQVMAPAVRRLLGEGQAADAPEHAAAIPASPSGSKTVLVVDDDEAIRDLVREVLELRGYTVLEARHGADALAVSEGHRGPIHLLLTDLDVPGMGGPALADQLARTRPRTKVVYMSGHSADVVRAQAAAGRPAGFLQKPFSPDSLVGTVREVLAEAPDRR